MDMTNSIDPQPKDQAELLRTIRALSDERRIEARARARELVVKEAGEEPRREDFNNHTTSKYPEWMMWVINISCFIVLLAAFLPSAFRLMWIGSTTFVQSLQDAYAAMITGFSIVIMAELSMVLFSIASVVIEAHKPSEPMPDKLGCLGWIAYRIRTLDSVQALLMVSELVATSIALIGNAEVSLSGTHQHTLFSVVEAFSPSIIIFTTSYVLKAQMLNSIHRRHANTLAFAAAWNAWKAATATPEASASYRPHLHNALKEFVREDNEKGKSAAAQARREYMAGLVVQDWRALVWRELQADNWYEDPVHSQPVHSFANEQRERREQVHSANTVQPVNGVNGVNEFTPRTDVKSIVRAWFEAHPEHMDTSLDVVLPLIKAETGVEVGRTSVYNVRKSMKVA